MSEVITLQKAAERAKSGDQQARDWLEQFDQQRAQATPQTSSDAQAQRIYERAHRIGKYA